MERRKANAYSISDFYIGKLIGEGLFGKVHHAKVKKTLNLNLLPDRHVAIKAMDKLEIMKCKQRSKMVMKERRLLTKLTQLGSKHTVQLFMSFVDSQNLYLVQEICIFGTLAAIRQQHRLPIEKIRSYSAQILTGIEFMHHHSIVHCDLKPENIMVANNDIIKIVDFGCAIDLESANENDEKGIDFAGTADYVSPEVIGGKRKSSKADAIAMDVIEGGNNGSLILPHYSLEYAPAIDLWAFGCIIYFLFCAESPFHDETDHLTLNRIITYVKQDWHLRDREGLVVSFYDDNDLMQTTIDLLEKLLLSQPGDRLGMGDGRHDAIRSHDFYKDHSFSSLNDATNASDFPQLRPQIQIDTVTKDEMQDGAELPFDFFA